MSFGYQAADDVTMPVKSVGIREAKAQLSALARAAANGEPTLLTDYGEPRAVITSIKSDADGQAVGISDPSEFKQCLLAVPFALELDF
jgi:prevent-host-death family protein